MAERPALSRYVGHKLAMGVRSEDMEDASLVRGDTDDRRISATVLVTEALGSEVVVRFGVDVDEVVTKDTRALAEDAQTNQASKVATAVAKSQWVASFGPRTRVKPTDDIEVAIDMRQVHFFDPGTGLSIRT